MEYKFEEDIYHSYGTFSKIGRLGKGQSFSYSLNSEGVTGSFMWNFEVLGFY